MPVCVKPSPNGEGKITPETVQALLVQWLFSDSKAQYEGVVTIVGTELQAKLRMRYDGRQSVFYEAQSDLALQLAQDFERQHPAYTVRIAEFIVRDDKNVITQLL